MLHATNAAVTDETLMAAYQRGDLGAFDALVTRHERPLWNFLRRSVRDAAMAEDLLQETFMRVVKSAPRWRPEAKFSTWLYTLARNLCIDHARRAVFRKTASLDGRGGERDSGSMPPLRDRLDVGDRGAETATANRQLAARIDAAVDALPEAQREVFLMREVLCMPFAEIAVALSENPATIKSRMRYALERLREALQDLRPGDASAHSATLGEQP